MVDRVKNIPKNIKSFYKNHFPTDRESFNYRLPLIGLGLTFVFLHFTGHTVGALLTFEYIFDVKGNLFFECLYVAVAAFVTYELYYGLKYGDRKHYTPWILIKIMEISLTLFYIVYYCFIFYMAGYNRYSVTNFVLELIYGFSFLVFNIWLTYIIILKSYNEYNNGVPQINNANTNRETYGISHGIFYINK